MFHGFAAPEHWQTATPRIAAYLACVSLIFLAALLIGFHRGLQGPKNILAQRGISVPAEIQPKLLASYGKLPLGFEANQGQASGPVKFLARGHGYTIFLTADEVVLTLRKSSVVSGQSSAGTKQNPGIRTHEPEGKTGQRTTDHGPRTTDHGQWTADSVLRMKLVGANVKATVTGAEELPGKSNYFIGNDPKKWRTNVSSYARVKYEGVYPGVDLVYYGNQRQLEYDFVVGPGADPNRIKLSFAGADGMRVDAASGDLVLKVGEDEVRFHKPVVYQPAVAAVSDRRRRSQSAATGELDGSFVLASNNQVAFRVAGYDPKRALVIDPVLSYSTYLGGSGLGDYGSSIAVDAAGNAYVTGRTSSGDFPTFNPIQAREAPGEYSAFVAKLNPAGSALVYSTYLGGIGWDEGLGIAADAAGNAYVTGYTDSSDFPTVNPLQATNKALGFTAFVAKLNPAGGALVYSTYLGGSGEDEGWGIAVDAADNAYVTGWTTSTDFPTVNPFQAKCGSCTSPLYANAFVAKLNPAGSALVYSTYLGGSGNDSGGGIAVDAAGNAYVTGFTESTDFPTANPLQATYSGGTCGTAPYTYACPDAFVTKLNPSGSALAYSTYLGGSGSNGGNGIAADAAGHAYVTGYTTSTDFPTANPLQGACDNCYYHGQNAWSGNAFVAKLNPAGSALVYSTYLGGSGGLFGGDYGAGIAVDAAGNAYVTGRTTSTDFPTANPVQPTYGGDGDAFVAELNPSGSALVYSTYLGGSGSDAGSGIAVDAAGNAYVTGVTASGDFPTVNPIQATNKSYEMGFGYTGNVFVAKIIATVTLSPTSLSFSNQLVGTTSPAQAVTLSNIGNANQTISSIAIAGSVTGDFAVATEGTTCSTSSPLAAGTSCTINVTFTPTIAGSESASLSVSDNIAPSPLTVPLSGTGVLLPATNVSPTSLSFNNQRVGTTSTPQAVTVTNTASLALSINSLTISTGWTQSNNCLPSIAANGSCTINVRFQPNAAGSQTGTLTLTDNASNSPQTVSLTGTGIGINAVPTLSALSPSSARAGEAAFTLTVTGTNFVSTSTVQWNGTGLATTYVSGTKLSASVPPNHVATARTASVRVMNPTPGGGASWAVTFTVDNPAPTLASLSPSSARKGGAAFTLTVTGTKFVSTSTVQWNGTGLTTTYVSGTTLTASVPASEIATAGTASVTVMNPTPGGGRSSGLTFTIN
jgi:hypothetical protein